MDNKSVEELIIKKYQDGEKTMIRLFVEWCRNHQLDPHMVYHLAYPEQEKNSILIEILEEIDQQDPLKIPDHTLLEVLQYFGNDELAFVVVDLIEKKSRRS
ncbi:hypothetical protein [Sporosarcina pasteurii]|uniref:YxiS n=1 Tax=Sporosarcina pasteurii TaxID=1474 RepID=A0A380C6T2_SPOPA|nr:hypothetical protein [Sporosarcina pasteurii]MDS9473073.1 hypothetical protein [Sporosarcina pasteurii]QBQ04578.1 hypothetical protein E2C16_02270 [Sporosarcina pasteurii]SUJ14024.1 Uncharacterised protein [Sporosarcina pasteurii]